MGDGLWNCYTNISHWYTPKFSLLFIYICNHHFPMVFLWWWSLGGTMNVEIVIQPAQGPCDPPPIASARPRMLPVPPAPPRQGDKERWNNGPGTTKKNGLLWDYTFTWDFMVIFVEILLWFNGILVGLPSGNDWHSYGKSQFLVGNSTLNSHVQ